MRGLLMVLSCICLIGLCSYTMACDNLTVTIPDGQSAVSVPVQWEVAANRPRLRGWNWPWVHPVVTVVPNVTPVPPPPVVVPNACTPVVTLPGACCATTTVSVNVAYGNHRHILALPVKVLGRVKDVIVNRPKLLPLRGRGGGCGC